MNIKLLIHIFCQIYDINTYLLENKYFIKLFLKKNTFFKAKYNILKMTPISEIKEKMREQVLHKMNYFITKIKYFHI